MNLRPGAFITHDFIEKAMQYKARGIAIVAQGGTASKLCHIQSAADVAQHFPEACNARSMIEFVQGQVFCDIVAVGLGDTKLDSYKTAIDLVLADKECYLVVTDIENAELVAYANESIKKQSVDKLFLSGCGNQSDAAAFARSFNSERICLTIPAIFDSNKRIDYSPLFLAVLAASRDSITSNLAGEKISTEFFINAELSEADKNLCLYNGISVFEGIGESIYLVRGMTTRTLDGDGNYDCTYRNIGVVVAADTVKFELISELSRRINTKTQIDSADTVLTLVVSQLERLAERKLIKSYDRPVVHLDPVDPSICKISVNVGIMQGLKQICLQLNRQV